MADPLTLNRSSHLRSRVSCTSPLSFAPLLLVSAVAAQTTGTWTRQSPLPTAVDLRGISQAPGGALWAVGQNGVVTSSVDGGISWQTSYQSVSPELHDVSFTDALHGWIAGQVSLRTVDGGASWQPMGLASQMYDVSFGDALHGVICNDTAQLFRTQDGGQNWLQVTAPGATRLHDAVMVDANVGWVVGRRGPGNQGGVYRTINGGQSWSQQSTPGTSEFYVVAAIDPLTAWASTGPQLWRTTDGGLSWQLTLPPSPVLAMAFRTPLDGIAVSVGTHMRTDDGGVTWQLIPGFSTEDGLQAITWTDPISAFGCGYFGAIASTQDTGLSWQQVSQGYGDIVTDIAVVDDFRAFACTSQQHRLLRTDDGGLSWRMSELPQTVFQFSPESLDFVDANTGWLISTSPSDIARTDDGGDTWQLQLTSDSQFYEMMAFSTDVAVAAGAWDTAVHTTPAGRVMRTSDGGQNWIDITPQFFGLGNNAWYGSFNLTDQRGWLVGKVVVQTTDAGASWNMVLGATGTGVLFDVSFADVTTGWVVGQYGKIYKTVDEGQTWQPQNAGVTADITSVSAVNRRVAWIATADGSTLRTIDGGISWTLDSTAEAVGDFSVLHMQSEDRGWVVGHPLPAGVPGGNIYQRRPETELDLTFRNLRAGATAELRAHGTAPNEIVLYVFSDDPLPTGGCSVAAPFCVDLSLPLNVLGLSLGGADGSALLTLPIPATLISGQVRVQCAALRAGALVTSNAVTRSLVTN